ncbi:hypothetical protein [Vitreimonas flagellata]|uniref:hypothetical protein n=1 Tax=Vitreimonas flagellata TaxID=2560861 RepID=UPI001075695F|nr:hypothetical protein [Vitreimonas flagellata]
MDRTRFEALLAAYGADVSRWPESERADAQAFVAAHGGEVSDLREEAREIDDMLAHASVAPNTDALAARILAAAPRRAEVFDRRALLALAACAVFGVVLGYGGGLLAPAPLEDDSYFAMAFEAPGEEG